VLAQKLMLQFADKAIEWRTYGLGDKVTESLNNGHCVTFPQKASVSVMSEFVILHDFLTMRLFGNEDFQALAPMVSMLQHRKTTRPSDQTLCACVIMGKDPDPLLKAGVEEDGRELEGKDLEDRRMECFLKMMGKFPSSIIFNRCPRLKRDGFRWGPRTFLGIQKNAYLENVEGEVAVLTDDKGLAAKYPGLIINETIRCRRLSDVRFMLRRQSGDPIQLRIGIAKTQGFQSNHEQEEEKQFAVIFSRDITIDSTSSPSQYAVVGSIRDIRRGKEGAVEQVFITHEFLAVITVLNPSAVTGSREGKVGEAVQQRLFKADISSALAPSSDAKPTSRFGNGGLAKATDGEGSEDNSGGMNTSTEDRTGDVACEIVGSKTQWLIY